MNSYDLKWTEFVYLRGRRSTLWIRCLIPDLVKYEELEDDIKFWRREGILTTLWSTTLQYVVFVKVGILTKRTNTMHAIPLYKLRVVHRRV